jgi:3-methyladenine DNA glycosylase/8-oxoguanine DNA glycosylase
MLLIFKLGRPNIFPSNDIGIQNGFQKLFRKRRRPTAQFLERHSRKWHPYRTLAAWYLWRATDEAIVLPKISALNLREPGLEVPSAER